jgi:RimJ/RimL family protein N-acetyltransferase
VGQAIKLRAIAPDDLDTLFEQQLDADANRMAAFGAADPTDRAPFDARWTKIQGDPSILVRAIETDRGELAGSILLWRDPDLPGPEVSYWLGRAFWGRGIATAALLAFLGEIPTRPLFGRAAADNTGSLRVLEKAGFVRIGEDEGWSDLRGATVPEVILRLDS